MVQKFFGGKCRLQVAIKLKVTKQKLLLISFIFRKKLLTFHLIILLNSGSGESGTLSLFQVSLTDHSPNYSHS